MERQQLPVQRSATGGCHKQSDGDNRCINHGVGCDLQWSGSERALVTGACQISHKCPGAVHHHVSAPSFSLNAEGASRLGQNGQHISNSICQPPGRSEISHPLSGGVSHFRLDRESEYSLPQAS